MKLRDALENNYANMATASQNLRTLSLAAIGLVWVFKSVPASGGYELPKALAFGLLFAVLALASDFLQYVWGSFEWWWIHRAEELKDRDANREFEPSVSWNRPGWVFFWAKMLLLAVAYGCILTFVAGRIALS